MKASYKDMDNELIATGMQVWIVKNRIASKRSQGIGSIENENKRIIIRIDTNQGYSGYGEAAPWPVFSGSLESATASLTQYLWPLVKNQNILDIPKIMTACDQAIVGNTEAKAAIEIALHDAVGKKYNIPIYQLLGGKAQDRIPFSFSLANPCLEKDIEMASEMVKTGNRIFKIKTGFLDHRRDLQRVEKIRSTLPDEIDIRIDYNQGLPSFGALKCLKDMESFNLTFIEQPLKAGNLEGMAYLSRKIDTPILADESVFDQAAAVLGIEKKIASAFSIKLMKSGGLTNAKSIANIAEASNIPCYGGTLFEGGIALNAAIHFILATKNVSLGCEFYVPKYVFTKEEVESDIKVDNGYVYPYEGPGIGVDVNEDVLNKIKTEIKYIN